MLRRNDVEVVEVEVEDRDGVQHRRQQRVVDRLAAQPGEEPVGPLGQPGRPLGRRQRLGAVDDLVGVPGEAVEGVHMPAFPRRAAAGSPGSRCGRGVCAAHGSARRRPPDRCPRVPPITNRRTNRRNSQPTVLSLSWPTTSSRDTSAAAIPRQTPARDRPGRRGRGHPGRLPDRPDRRARRVDPALGCFARTDPGSRPGRRQAAAADLRLLGLARRRRPGRARSSRCCRPWPRSS